MLKTRVLLLMLCALMLGAGSIEAQGYISNPSWERSLDTIRSLRTTVIAGKYAQTPTGGIYSDNARLEAVGLTMPAMKADNVFCSWNAAHDSLRVVTQKAEDLVFLYGGYAVFRGSLIITHASWMTGNGSLTMGNVLVESDSFVFQRDDHWVASNAKFAVFDPQNPSYQSFVVAHAASVDFDVPRQQAVVIAGDQPLSVGIAMQGENWSTNLRKLTYRGKIGEIDFEPITLGKPKEFTSVSSDGSIQFYAGHARYLVAQHEIKIGRVPYIYIADAKISPFDGRVDILADGHVKDLHLAVIEADQRTNYHRFFDAEVHIISPKQYTATAKYDYILLPIDWGRGIPFKLHVQGDSMTVGEGEVEEGQFGDFGEDFFLNEGMSFKGQATMTSQEKYLHFHGQVEVNLENELFAGKSFTLDAVVNPDSLILPLNKPAFPGLNSGIHIRKADRSFYSTFLSANQSADDLDIALATDGGIMYDRSTGEFKIGSLTELQEHDYRGTTCAYNPTPTENAITTIGKLQLPTHFLPKTIAMSLAGRWREEIDPQEITTDLVASIDFSCIPKSAWEKLCNKAQVVMAVNNTVDWGNQDFKQGLAEFLDPNEKRDPKNMQAFLTQVEKSLSYNDIKPAEQIPGSLLLSGLQLRYDREMNALWYSGEIGILGIQQVPVNKLTTSNSKIEYRMGRTIAQGLQASDTLRIYLEFDEMNWVFFEFYDDVMRTTSSDVDGYNAILEKRSPSKGYRYKFVKEDEKDHFLNIFVNRYIWMTGRS